MTQGSTRNGSGDVKIMQQKPLNATFSSLPTTIFTVMTNLSVQYSSVNLGQGELGRGTAVPSASQKLCVSLELQRKIRYPHVLESAATSYCYPPQASQMPRGRTA